jgi:hypothetical protein
MAIGGAIPPPPSAKPAWMKMPPPPPPVVQPPSNNSKSDIESLKPRWKEKKKRASVETSEDFKSANSLVSIQSLQSQSNKLNDSKRCNSTLDDLSDDQPPSKVRLVRNYENQYVSTGDRDLVDPQDEASTSLRYTVSIYRKQTPEVSIFQIFYHLSGTIL